MRKTKEAPSIAEQFRELAEASKELLSESRYLGPCVVQCPGAWTRIGPTWVHPNLGWICLGPGVANWGTTMGLAELATLGTAKPNWHASGVGISSPNVSFVMTHRAIDAYPDIQEWATAAKKWLPAGTDETKAQEELLHDLDDEE